MSEEQRAINQRISRHVPRHAWQSTVPIVVAVPPAVHQLGSGTLFQVADRQFIVTAGHVIRSAHKSGATIGVGTTTDDDLIAITGDWICTVPSEGSGEDPYDVAVYPLPSPTADRLQDMQFLRIRDVDFDDPGPRAVFTVFGYPGLWSSASRAVEDRVIVKPLEYTTYAYDGDSKGLRGYRSDLHLLLAAGPEHNTREDGSSIEFRDRSGQPARFPIGLKGMSGCSVWHVGNLDVPIERWADRPAHVVGVETGVYQSSGVITASRWAIVTTLIHKAFPELRRWIELWRP
jgi:hypothetical protein